MASRVEILIIEDDEDDFILTRELILDIDVDAYAIEWASTFEAGLARLATRTFDVCLVDFRLGARTGVELLREARGRGHELPVIFLTGQREHEFDVEAMRAGASDYLVKGELMPIQLERSIRYAIERARALAELRELNEELRLARDRAVRASQAKSMFLANMSHEFRTPLNAIIGYSELVIEQAEDTGDVELTQDVHNIRVAGEHLLTLVTDILDLSKIEAGRLELQLETFSVRALLDEVNAAILPIATANRNRLEIRCADDVGEMHSDPTRIRQALINVLGNACKFTADGLVRVTVSRRPALESDFSVLGTGVPIVGTDCVEFVVEDTGIGMTSSQISRLFENFSQADAGISRRFGGTGLGLVISRRLCRLMGGEIFATSEFGVGSTFRIALPAEISEEASAEVDVTDRPIAVFMGQNLDTLREIGEKLEPHAIDVTRGRDIEDAEALVASRGEVLIVDEIVVQEPSSWLTLAELRQAAALRPIPVVAYISDISGQFGRALDVVDVLARPLRADALFEALRRLGAGEPTAVRSNDPALVEQAQAILASASANADAEPQDDGDLEWTLEIVDVSLPGVDARGIFPNEEAPREGDERVYTIIAVPSSGDELTLHRLNENTEKLLDLRPLPRGYMIDEVCAFIRDRLGR